MKRSTYDALCDNDASGPGKGSATVVPHDSTNFTVTEVGSTAEAAVARRLEIYSAGTVSFVGADGVTDTRTFTGAMSYPQIIAVVTKRVNATGTTVTAGDIKAIW